MARLSLKLVGYPWDHITPLLTREIEPEGIDLTYDTTAGLGALAADRSFDGGEGSIGGYLIRTARGDRELIGLPIFPMFAFRHRCFLVRRGTVVADLKALEGKRVGMDGWPNSGNTWTKITLTQAGVDIWKIEWVIAPVDGPGDATHGQAPPDAPPNVVSGPAGRSLVDLLLAGEIDVLVTAFMPRGFFEPNSPLVPMLPNYPALEAAYFREHGYVPAHHLITMRRTVLERDPWVARSLYDAYGAAKALTIERRRHYAETSPWLLAELSRAAEVFGADWQPYGLEPNLEMLSDFCQGQAHQRLVPTALDPRAAFADATRLLATS